MRNIVAVACSRRVCIDLDILILGYCLLLGIIDNIHFLAVKRQLIGEIFFNLSVFYHGLSRKPRVRQSLDIRSDSYDFVVKHEVGFLREKPVSCISRSECFYLHCRSSDIPHVYAADPCVRVMRVMSCAVAAVSVKKRRNARHAEMVHRRPEIVLILVYVGIIDIESAVRCVPHLSSLFVEELIVYDLIRMQGQSD